MNPKFKNNKVSRSLQAILAGADEEVKKEAGVSEMVAESDKKEKEEKKEEEVKEEEVKEVEDEETEDKSDKEDEEEEVEESDEEVDASKKKDEEEDEEEPEEIIEEEEVEDEEDNEDEDEEVEDEDDEPIDEEEIEEITDEEVEAARKSAEEDEEEPEEISEEDEEKPENQSIEEVMDEEPVEDEEEPDEDATTEAVAALVKDGFVCSIDEKGKICVTACGEPVESCDCGSEECPECNPKKEEKEEEACVTLNPVTDEDKVEAEDVTCVQSGTEEKPFYTVLIKGMPTATICLEDQPNAEAIRAYFLSNEYPRKLASAMAKGGVKNVLDTQKARMFTVKAEKSELAQTMKAEAKAEFDKQIAEAVTKMAEKFANSIKLAVAGMNKNFFTEDNDLKAATYAAFTELGCNEDVAYDKVNKVFAQADKFFDTVIAKAQELMGKSDEAFAEVSEMVANAGVASKPAKTFASALSEGNNPVIAGVMQDQQKVEAKAESKIRTMRMFR